MPKHKHEDYKVAAVEHYLEHGNYEATANTFKCAVRSLKRWKRRNEEEQRTVQPHNRIPIAYKVTQLQVDYALALLEANEQLSILEQHKNVRAFFGRHLEITPKHLGIVIRDMNKTRKCTRILHTPDEILGAIPTIQARLDAFYNITNNIALNRIICLDETKVHSGMIPNYSRCSIGERCEVVTRDNRIHNKYNLLAAITDHSMIGAELYPEDGVNAHRVATFINTHINNALNSNKRPNYRGYLVIMDNIRMHTSPQVVSAVERGGNTLLYSVPYRPNTNAIEGWFSELKYQLKLDTRILNYNGLVNQIRTAIQNIPLNHYNSHFRYSYRRKSMLRFERKGINTLPSCKTL
jgi:hypothetical protein